MRYLVGRLEMQLNWDILEDIHYMCKNLDKLKKKK